MSSPLLAIWLLHAAALVTPGPNVLLVSQLAASGDRRGAAYAAVGVSLGAFLWSTAAVLGVGAAFARYPGLRLALQVTGAAYLLHVGFASCRVPSPASRPRASLATSQALRAGLLTNLSNPKAALFFASIFTSALPSHAAVAVRAASVGLILANALAWHLLLAWLLSRPSAQRVYASRRGLLSFVAGGVVAAIGAWLLLSAARSAALTP